MNRVRIENDETLVEQRDPESPVYLLLAQAVHAHQGSARGAIAVLVDAAAELIEDHEDWQPHDQALLEAYREWKRARSDKLNGVVRAVAKKPLVAGQVVTTDDVDLSGVKPGESLTIVIDEQAKAEARQRDEKIHRIRQSALIFQGMHGHAPTWISVSKELDFLNTAVLDGMPCHLELLSQGWTLHSDAADLFFGIDWQPARPKSCPEKVRHVDGEAALGSLD